MDVNSVYPELGRGFNREDDQRRRLVCAIGQDLIQDLEMPDKPVGEYLRVGNEWCKVIGVMEKRGEIFGFSQDNYVMLPYETARRIQGSSRDLDIQVQMQVEDIERMEEVKERIRRLLRSAHGLKRGEPNDFKVQTSEQLTESFNNIIATITAAVGGIVECLPAGRRHRHHEHHAGVGHRTHP